MSQKNSKEEVDMIKYAQEQFNFHISKAKQFELFLAAFNLNNKSNGTVTNITVPVSVKKKDVEFFNTIIGLFNQHPYELFLARDLYDKSNDKGFIGSYITFLNKLSELVKGKDIERIEIPNVANKIKFWYGSLECLGEDKLLKANYKLKLEEKIKNLK